MIQLSEDYKVERDQRCWILYTATQGRDRHGNPKTHWRETYHGTLEQVANKIADSACEARASVQEIKEAVEQAAARIEAAVKQATE